MFKNLALMILSIVLINITVQAQTIQVQLNKNQSAPFKGILVPEETYRKMHVDIFQKVQFEQALQDVETENAYLKEQEDLNENLWAVSGFGAGVLTTILIVLVGRK